MIPTKLEKLEKKRYEHKQVLRVLEAEVKQLIDKEHELQGKMYNTQITEERLLNEITKQLNIIEQLDKKIEFEKVTGVCP